MERHKLPCFGGHNFGISCEEATQIREQERRNLFFCSASGNGKHAFMGDTRCANGCGRYIFDLMPDEE